MQFNYEIELSFESNSDSSSDSSLSEIEINTTKKRKQKKQKQNKNKKSNKNKNILETSFDFRKSVEIPQIPSSDLFKPLIAEEHKTSLTTLPPDILRNIVMNLNYESFVQLSSTCKTMQQFENDEVVMRKICNIPNNYASVNQCIETVKNRKQQQKIEDNRKKEFRQKKRVERFENIAYCNRRCSSNVGWEYISLAMIFIGTIVGSTSLDRTSSVPLVATAWILFIPMIYFGLLPYFLWCWGCLIRNDHDHIEKPNRDVKLYGGVFDYFNQLFLWSKLM